MKAGVPGEGRRGAEKGQQRERERAKKGRLRRVLDTGKGVERSCSLL